ncbi:MAG: twin transmembrane helix small protein [Xanthomonadaceae bacterium]|nr:twin transmembrane helix small protein [Xanthomonadaceae bacterium]
MWVNLVIIAFLAVIVFSLGSAMFYLVREPHGSKKTVRALSWRIGLSLLLFVLLMLGIFTGVIVPHGLGG